MIYINLLLEQRLSWMLRTDHALYEAVQILLTMVELGTNPEVTEAVLKWRSLFDNRSEARKKNAALFHVLGFSENIDPSALVKINLPNHPGRLLGKQDSQTAAICGAGAGGVTTAIRVVAFEGRVYIFSDPDHTTK